MLQIAVPPDCSGLDIFGQKTIETLNSIGIRTSLRHLWPKGIYRFFNSGHIPFGRRFFRLYIAPIYSSRVFKNMKGGDVAWVQSFCVPGAPLPDVERRLKNTSVSYIFHLMDNWFDVDFFREGTIRRCELAELVGVPTPQLAQQVKENVPSANVEIFEEPIDLDRLSRYPNEVPHGMPVVLWCGNPFNLNSIQKILPILRRVNLKKPFVFRVICGAKPPSAFAEGLNFEWNRFDHDTEGRLIAGSWIGLAPMEDAPYTKCKGAYKVKTYLAAGLPVVASPVGFQAELVRAGGDVGFLPQSPAEWEEAIITLIGNPSLCSEMGANSRKYATSRFGHPAAISRWVPILQKHFPQLTKSN